jgi:hypothetical protein
MKSIRNAINNLLKNIEGRSDNLERIKLELEDAYLQAKDSCLHWHTQKKITEEKIKTVQGKKENLCNAIKLLVNEGRHDESVNEAAKLTDVETEIEFLQNQFQEEEKLEENCNEVKDKIHNKLDYIKNNYLRLKAEQNMEEIKAFIDPTNPENTTISKLLSTHEEMVSRLDANSSMNEARYEVAQGNLSAEAINSQKSEDAERKRKAEEMVKKLKLEMGKG